MEFPDGGSGGVGIFDVIVEFLEALIHELLYTRRIYPEAMFERRAKYGLVVHMSRHPKLNEYIANVIVSCRDLLEQDALERLYLVVKGPSGSAVERHGLDIGLKFGTTEPIPVVDLQEQFRAMLTKVGTLDVLLNDLKGGEHTFTMVAQTHGGVEGAGMPASIADAWVPLTPRDPELTHVQAAGGAGRVRPVKSVEAGPVSLSLFVEAPL